MNIQNVIQNIEMIQNDFNIPLCAIQTRGQNMPTIAPGIGVDGHSAVFYCEIVLIAFRCAIGFFCMSFYIYIYLHRPIQKRCL